MRNYEIMMIIRPNSDEKTIKDLADKMKKVLEDNKSKVTDFKELGQKELAYEIEKCNVGYYFLYNLEANDDVAIKEFDRVASINENIIRHMIIKLEK